MELTRVLETIQNLTKDKAKKVEIAEILGIKPQNVNRDAKILSGEQLKKLEKYYGIDFENQCFIQLYDDETVEMKYFTDVIGSCGSGCFEQSDRFDLVPVPVRLIKNFSPQKQYSIINAYGDSMYPTIKNADKLIIEGSSSSEIIDNKIYVFSYNEKIYIKRLVQNIDEIVVISDNENKEIYKTKVINQDNIDKIYIIGQVIGIFRDLRG